MENDRRDGEWSKDGAPATQADVNCALCSKTIEVGEIQVDAFHWDHEGELDCIELAHAECVCKQKHKCTVCDYDEDRSHCSTLS
jgi:hypothetical protein